MITFLLLVVDATILAIAYIIPRKALRNLAETYNTNTKTLLDNCSNLSTMLESSNEIIILSLISKILTCVGVYFDKSATFNNNGLIAFLMLDFVMIIGNWMADAEEGGFYVKSNDLKKLSRRRIKM